jgi:hypothetical protein
MLPHCWRGQDPKPNTDAQRLGLELPTIADVDAELILASMQRRSHARTRNTDPLLDRRLRLASREERT